MMIACPRCGAAYEVDPALFGARPRVVQCCDCDCRWMQQGTPTAAVASEAGGEAGEDAAAAVDSPAWSDDRRTDAPTMAAPPADATDSTAEAAESADGWGTNAAPPFDPTLPDSPISDGDDDTVETQAPAERPNRRRPPSAPVAAGIAAVATAIALLSLLVLLRGPMIDLLPRSAGFYAVLGLLPDPLGAGLEIRDISSARGRDGGGDVLTVTGVVANTADEPAPLPMLRVSLYDAEDNEVQSITVPGERDMLAAGEALNFDARIPDPRPEARRVRVGFTTAAASDPSSVDRP
jgi:predicted Zn finger-like uncharacterized protein